MKINNSTIFGLLLLMLPLTVVANCPCFNVAILKQNFGILSSSSVCLVHEDRDRFGLTETRMRSVGITASNGRYVIAALVEKASLSERDNGRIVRGGSCSTSFGSITNNKNSFKLPLKDYNDCAQAILDTCYELNIRIKKEFGK